MKIYVVTYDYFDSYWPGWKKIKTTHWRKRPAIYVFEEVEDAIKKGEEIYKNLRLMEAELTVIRRASP